MANKTETPVHKTSGGNWTVTVYANRVVIHKRKIGFRSDEDVIPLSQVASVSAGNTGVVKLETTGGRSWEMRLGRPAKGKALRDAIARLL